MENSLLEQERAPEKSSLKVAFTSQRSSDPEAEGRQVSYSRNHGNGPFLIVLWLISRIPGPYPHETKTRSKFKATIWTKQFPGPTFDDFFDLDFENFIPHKVAWTAALQLKTMTQY